jgi:hypothetical protein
MWYSYPINDREKGKSISDVFDDWLKIDGCNYKGF